MTFSERLQKARKRLKVSQARMSAILSLPPRTYWDYETGKAIPHEIAQEGAMIRLKKAKVSK
jgi:transcriptional regulator with XRE-family HTH domain